MGEIVSQGEEQGNGNMGSVPNFFQTFLAFEYVSDDHLCIDCGIWALEQVV
jgi:hypothetical protein